MPRSRREHRTVKGWTGAATHKLNPRTMPSYQPYEPTPVTDDVVAKKEKPCRKQKNAEPDREPNGEPVSPERILEAGDPERKEPVWCPTSSCFGIVSFCRINRT